MLKYLLTYHGGNGMAPTEEENAAIMADWMSWFAQLGEALVEPGLPLAAIKTVSGGGVTDGGGVNPVTGWTVLQADNLDAAVALTRDCPVLKGGGTIEIGETIPMG